MLGHRIAISNWPEGVKQTVWAAFTFGFFSAVRFGEILADGQARFDATRTLLLKDVLFENDRVLVHVKLPKVKKREGDFIDLFEAKTTLCCPVAALKRLRTMQSQGGYTNPAWPVFCFPSGRLLTTAMLNSILQDLTTDFCFKDENKLTCHSFRGGFATTLLNGQPEKIKEAKVWGRWSSNSYEKYIRASVSSKKKIFDSLLDIM